MTILSNVAVICPECSYQWTLSVAVAASWFCPRCGGARTQESSELYCLCGDTYQWHVTHALVAASCDAFCIQLEDRDKLDDILANDPAALCLGGCPVCGCKGFRREPPFLAPAEFLHEVSAAILRGAGGGGITVTAADDGVIEFRESHRLVRSIILPNGTIRMGRRLLVMGRVTVGETVIAVRRMLHRAYD